MDGVVTLEVLKSTGKTSHNEKQNFNKIRLGEMSFLHNKQKTQRC